MITPNEIQRCIEEVPGAKVTNFEENPTLEVVGDMPPCSVRFTVEGGATQDVGDALDRAIPMGVETVGDIAVDVGVLSFRTVRFSRPKEVA